MATPRSAWRGAIELAGFPVNVALYAKINKRRSESFKTLAPNGKPVSRAWLDTDGNLIPDDQTSRGVPSGDGWVVMTDEAIEMIGERERSTVLAPDAFTPIASLPLDLATERWVVRPDDKVPGAEKSINIVWNGLRKTKLAYVSVLTARAGGNDTIIAFYATDKELVAAGLPFTDELYDVPDAGDTFKTDAKAASLFENVISTTYGGLVGNFDHASYASESRARRNAAIEMVLAGGKKAPAKTKKATAKAPDLMAALAASIATAKTTKKVKV